MRKLKEVLRLRYELGPQWHEQIGDPTLADSILDRLGA